MLGPASLWLRVWLTPLKCAHLHLLRTKFHSGSNGMSVIIQRSARTFDPLCPAFQGRWNWHVLFGYLRTRSNQESISYHFHNNSDFSWKLQFLIPPMYITSPLKGSSWELCNDACALKKLEWLGYLAEFHNIFTHFDSVQHDRRTDRWTLANRIALCSKNSRWW